METLILQWLAAVLSVHVLAGGDQDASPILACDGQKAQWRVEQVDAGCVVPDGLVEGLMAHPPPDLHAVHHNINEAPSGAFFMPQNNTSEE